MRLLPKFILALALLSPCAAQAQFSSGIVTATSQTVTINSQNRPVIGVAVTANTNVTLIPEATVDGTNWATIQACAISTGTCVTSITSTGSWQIGSAGMSQVRLRVSAVGATPTATLAMMASTAGGGGGGSGGGGGGAVTIADGADVAEGATTDAAVAVGAAGTTEAKLRLMTTQLDNINTNVQSAIPAGTNIIGKVGIDQTTPGTTNGVQAQASENHIGEIASNQISVQVAQTVTAGATACTSTVQYCGYLPETALGGFMTIANAARVSGSLGAAGTGGILTNVRANTKTNPASKTGFQIDVFIFNASPSASTVCFDRTALSIAAGDFDKVAGIITIPSSQGNGAGWFPAVQSVTASVAAGIGTYYPITYDIASGTSLYACAVQHSTPIFGSTSDLSFKFDMLRN